MNRRAGRTWLRSPGIILPLVLGSVFLLDVGLRLLPNSRLEDLPIWNRFAPDNAALGRGEAGQWPVHGNLLTMDGGILPSSMERVGYQADGYGYLNGARGTSSPPAVAWIGSSFSLLGNPFPQQVARELGVPVYNASSFGTFGYDLDALDTLVDRLQLPPGGLVVYELQETEPIWHASGSEAERSCTFGDPAGVRALCERLRGLWRVSPLQMYAQRWYRAVSDRLRITNSAVVKAQLRSGAELMFPQDYLDRYWERIDERPAVEFFDQAAARLRQRNLEMLVVLTPGKYTVYRPLLAGYVEEEADRAPYIARVEAGLKQAGIGVVSLLPELRQGAEAKERQAELVYWADDTHWNEAGKATALPVVEAAIDQRLAVRGSPLTAEK